MRVLPSGFRNLISLFQALNQAPCRTIFTETIMLQPAPSHLSRLCAQSHFKKIWLLQTQRENQASESRKEHSEGNHSPLSSRTPPSRASASTAVLPPSSLVACGSYNGSPHTARRHASLISCAESLNPPRPTNFPCSLSPNVLSANRNAEDQALSEGVINYMPFKSPGRSCTPSSPSRISSFGVPAHDYLDQGESIKQVLSAGSQSRSYSSDNGLSSTHEEEIQANRDGCYKSVLGTQLTAIKQKAHSSPNVQVGIRMFTSDSSSDTENSAQNKAFSNTLKRQNGSKVEVLHQSESRTHGNESSHGFLGRELVEIHGGFSRVCSTCGTTKTPLWRTGPHGPKSLCNACGIRYKKAKRSSQDERSLVGSPGNEKITGKSLKRKQDMMVGPCSGWNTRSNFELAYVDATRQPVKRNTWVNLRMKAETVRENGNSIPPITVVQDGHPWELQRPSNASIMSEANKPGACDIPIALNRTTVKEDEEAASLLMYLSSGLIYA